MCTNRKFMFLPALLLLVSLVPGCTIYRGPADAFISPDSDKEQTRSAEMSKRFGEAPPQKPTIVESAIGLSEKYAKLSDQMVVTQQENQNLAAENQNLKTKLTACESQLRQTQKELTQANDILLEMRVELNNWKANVLGFRDEMRDSQKAQLEALLKILKTLGGEPRSESAANENPVSAAAPLNEPNAAAKEIQNSGEDK